MKSGWTTASLAEACEFQRGLTYAKSDEVDTSRSVVLRASNIDLATSLLDLGDLRFISDTVDVPASKRVREGSLLVCTASGSKAHLGKVALIDKDYGFAFGGFMGQLTPAERVLPKFLFYMLISDVYKHFIASLSDGANINNLKFADLGRFQIPVPPLPEQRRIVALLDAAFEGIATAAANAERNLQNARDLFESHLAEVFSRRGEGWVETTLGDEVDLLSGFAFKSSGYTSSPRSVRLLRGDNIVQGSLRWEDEKRWPEDDVANHVRFSLCEGDVVLAMDRPWVKAGLKRAQIGLEDLPCLLVQRTARLRAGGRLSSRFLYFLVSSASFVRHIVGVQTGSGVPHISGKQIKDFGFARPPLAAQRELSSRLDSLSGETHRLSQIYDQKQAALAALKRSLLHQAFAGEL